MKKIIILLLLYPFFTKAQSTEAEKIPTREFAFSPLPFLRVMNVSIENQPFFLEYKQLKGKKYWRVGVQQIVYISEPRSLFGQNIGIIKDSVLVLDTRSTTKGRGHLKFGTEIQKNIKRNPRVRYRMGVDALVGLTSEANSGSVQEYNLKTHQSTYRFEKNADKTITKFSLGTGVNLGFDILLGKRTYLGINAYAMATLSGLDDSVFDLDMRYSPYLAWKF